MVKKNYVHNTTKYEYLNMRINSLKLEYIYK